MNTILVTPLHIINMIQNTSVVSVTPSAASVYNETKEKEVKSHYWSLFLICIPFITIFGNLLVIISILRVKTLHSAINHLIMGLAIADLMVACAVMPYAVYVEVNNSVWNLGSFLCDIYCASDVACSTASILTLTVISFDRYRAVTQPIQYSRQSQNSRRVVLIIAGIWFISFATSSPIVFGLNTPPEGEDTSNECRFYNADFIILSSIISFGIPLIIVLFVYARIMVVLHNREKAARKRRAPHHRFKKHHDEESMAVSQLESKDEESSSGDKGDETTTKAETEAIESVITEAIESVTETEGPSSRRGTIESLHDSSMFTVEDTQSAGTAATSFKSASSQLLVPPHVDNSIPREQQIMNESINKGNLYRTASGSPNLLRIRRKIAERSISSVLGASSETTLTTDMKETPSDVMAVQFIDNEDIIATPIIAPLAPQELSPNITPRASEQELLSPNIINLNQRVRRRSLSEGCKDLMEMMAEEQKHNKHSAVSPALILRRLTDRDKEGKKEPVKPKFSMPAGPSCLDIAPPRKNTVAKLQRSLTTVMRKKTWINGNLASPVVRIVRRKESSFRKKVAKAQRKEKKATKTLGIVVGIFLICWLPFFSLNILNAVCIKLNTLSCQVGFLPFFLTTWLGYMNSFMNPIIYTVFNTEFRKAFKQILCPQRYKRQRHSHITTPNENAARKASTTKSTMV